MKRKRIDYYMKSAMEGVYLALGGAFFNKNNSSYDTARDDNKARIDSIDTSIAGTWKAVGGYLKHAMNQLDKELEEKND